MTTQTKKWKSGDGFYWYGMYDNAVISFTLLDSSYDCSESYPPYVSFQYMHPANKCLSAYANTWFVLARFIFLALLRRIFL